MTLLYIGMGEMAIFSPKPLMVIFFRAPGGRGIYKKLFEPTQRPTNPYMGWATPPTGRTASHTAPWRHGRRHPLAVGPEPAPPPACGKRGRRRGN
jgi:hypothetical protein